MRLALLALLLLSTWVSLSVADVYLHMPRGSNDRLDEANNNRANANRLFDSQNNNRGGYNVGSTYLYPGSEYYIEWTNQHGCGSNPNVHCQIVMQYMCDDTTPGIRDGAVTTTIPNNVEQQRNIKYGQHESYNYYQKCSQRRRNEGLWAPNRANIGNDATATRTRQNNNGNRHGFECPEERDYYPYWHPTPWRDIAVMVDSNDMSRLCPIYQSESQNVKAKHECSNPIHNNQKDCEANKAEWQEVKPWGTAPPQCVPTCLSRDNHLGNTLGGYMCSFKWIVPDLISEHCIFRMRYNITTGDVRMLPQFFNTTEDGYTWWTVDSRHNTFPIAEYPATQLTPGGQTVNLQRNPQVDFGLGIGPLQLAINVAQYGRTFQDRSHTFAIRPRPSTVSAADRIVNLQVRGKRGNIVQVYPAVEYDFHPNDLTIGQYSYVHLQWTGSNTNDNGNDGQGKAGTDRSNIVQFADLNHNFPIPMANATYLRYLSEDRVQAFTAARRLALLSDMPQYGGETAELDDAGTYLDGNLLQMQTQGVFVYGSTRNNNFSNRSQKARMIVTVPDTPRGLTPGQITAVVVGSFMLFGILLLLALFIIRSPSKFKDLFRPRRLTEEEEATRVARHEFVEAERRRVLEQRGLSPVEQQAALQRVREAEARKKADKDAREAAKRTAEQQKKAAAAASAKFVAPPAPPQRALSSVVPPTVAASAATTTTTMTTTTTTTTPKPSTFIEMSDDPLPPVRRQPSSTAKIVLGQRDSFQLKREMFMGGSPLAVSSSELASRGVTAALDVAAAPAASQQSPPSGASPSVLSRSLSFSGRPQPSNASLPVVLVPPPPTVNTGVRSPPAQSPASPPQSRPSVLSRYPPTQNL